MSVVGDQHNVRLMGSVGGDSGGEQQPSLENEHEEAREMVSGSQAVGAPSARSAMYNALVAQFGEECVVQQEWNRPTATLLDFVVRGGGIEQPLVVWVVSSRSYSR